MARRHLSPISAGFYEFEGLRLEGRASAPGSPTEGALYFDTTLDTARVYRNGAWSSLDEGWVPAGGAAEQVLTKQSSTDFDAAWTAPVVRELTKEVYNGSGSTIAAGVLVEIDGSAGAYATIRPADPSTAVSVDGITKESIGAALVGVIQIGGTFTGLNTSGLTSGSPLWLSTAGAFADVAPGSGAIIRVGKVGVVAPSGGTVVLDLPAFPRVAIESEYDNTASGLAAENVQEAIDEVSESGVRLWWVNAAGDETTARPSGASTDDVVMWTNTPLEPTNMGPRDVWEDTS